MIDSAVGHLNASILLAKTLKSNDFEVIYANICDFMPILNPLEFKVYELSGVVFGIGFDKYWHESNQSLDPYLDILIERLSFRIYQDRQKKLVALIEEIKPDVIFLDSFLTTDFIILYPYLQEKNIKLVFLQTMLSTLQSEGSPPLNTDLLPDNQKIVRKAWKKLFWQRKIQRIKDKISYLGKDDLSMVKQKYKENKIPKKYEIITE